MAEGGSLRVYLDARAMDGANVWDDGEKLLEIRNRVAKDGYELYKLRNRFDHRLAELGCWSKTLGEEDAA